MSNEASNEHGPTSGAVFGGRASIQGPSVGSPVFAGATGELDVPAAVLTTSGRGRDRIVWFLAIAGALTLLIGAGALASQAFSAQGGGATPEETVDALIASAAAAGGSEIPAKARAPVRLRPVGGFLRTGWRPSRRRAS